MIYDLFPVPVGFYRLDRELSAQELKTIHNLKIVRNTGNGVSSSKTILKEKSLHKLKEFFNASLQDYVNKTIAPVDSCRYYITSSWANYSAENEFHFPHYHTNCLVSAVFYVNAVKGRDCIEFEKKSTNMLAPDSKDYTPYNSTTWKFPVETNQLIFFPADLMHSVPPVGKGETRISISFNVFACGDIGNLKLKEEAI